MGEKFASISNRIHWSLALRSAVFGAAWYALSFPFFALVGIFLYCVPLFEPRRFLVPFLMLLFLAAVTPPFALFAFFFACALYLIVGMKDLILVKRAVAYEGLMLLLFLGLGFFFFSHFEAGISPAALFAAAVGMAAVSLLLSGFLSYEEHEEHPAAGRSTPFEELVASLLVGLALGECALALLLLPMNPLLRTGVFFLAAIVAAESVAEQSAGKLTRARIFGYCALLFALTVVMLSANQWGM